jgi:hypothetical protein
MLYPGVEDLEFVQALVYFSPEWLLARAELGVRAILEAISGDAELPASLRREARRLLNASSHTLLQDFQVAHAAFEQASARSQGLVNMDGAHFGEAIGGIFGELGGGFLGGVGGGALGRGVGKWLSAGHAEAAGEAWAEALSQLFEASDTVPDRLWSLLVERCPDAGLEELDWVRGRRQAWAVFYGNLPEHHEGLREALPRVQAFAQVQGPLLAPLLLMAQVCDGENLRYGEWAMERLAQTHDTPESWAGVYRVQVLQGAPIEALGSARKSGKSELECEALAALGRSSEAHAIVEAGEDPEDKAIRLLGLLRGLARSEDEDQLRVAFRRLAKVLGGRQVLMQLLEKELSLHALASKFMLSPEVGREGELAQAAQTWLFADDAHSVMGLPEGELGQNALRDWLRLEPGETVLWFQDHSGFWGKAKGVALSDRQLAWCMGGDHFRVRLGAMEPEEIGWSGQYLVFRRYRVRVNSAQQAEALAMGLREMLGVIRFG